MMQLFSMTEKYVNDDYGVISGGILGIAFLNMIMIDNTGLLSHVALSLPHPQSSTPKFNAYRMSVKLALDVCLYMS